MGLLPGIGVIFVAWIALSLGTALLWTLWTLTVQPALARRFGKG
jgi:hypothetical protein